MIIDNHGNYYLVVKKERQKKALGVSIFPLYYLLNGEERSYLEFPNQIIVESLHIFPILPSGNQTYLDGMFHCHDYLPDFFVLPQAHGKNQHGVLVRGLEQLLSPRLLGIAIPTDSYLLEG